MARDENLPFPVGGTAYGGDTSLINANALSNYEGQEYWVEDDDLSTGDYSVQGNRSNRKRRLRVVRNINATAALPREVHKLKIDGTTVTQFAGQIDGKTASYADKGLPVDEYLPAAGCLQNDLCYVVVDGFAQVVTDTSGDTNIPAGGFVVPGATTAGRVIELDPTLTGANLVKAMFNVIGRLTTTVNAVSTIVTVDVGATHR